MCHQTVGLIAAEIERRGVPTTSLSVCREITAAVKTPRALLVPYPFGYPLGRPGDRELQTSLLRSALALLYEAGPPPVLGATSEGVKAL